MSPTWILRTSSSNENWNGDCEAAVVTIDDPLMRLLIALRTQLISTGANLEAIGHGPQKNSLQLSVSDGSADFISYPYDEDFPGLLEVMDLAESGGGSMPIDPEGLEGGKWEQMHQRVECTRLFVDYGGIWWETVPKHSSVTITTGELTWEQLGL